VGFIHPASNRKTPAMIQGRYTILKVSYRKEKKRVEKTLACKKKIRAKVDVL
jgi:hypothetical protein